MSRILRTLLILLIIVALASWFFTVFKSCGAPKNAIDKVEEVASDAGSAVRDAAESTSEGIEDLFEDDDLEAADNNNASGDDENVGAGADAGTTSSSDSAADDAEPAEEADNGRNSTTASSDNRATVASESSGGWRYLVVTGSFMDERNAKIEAAKVKKSGFGDAEVVVFDLSQYYSVIAGRYSSLSQARKIENQLKAKGLEAYVHRKRSSKG